MQPIPVYDIERRATGSDETARDELRAKESRLILDRLRQWLDGPMAQSVLPSSKLGGALQYLESVITHMLRGTTKVEELLPDVRKTHHPESIRTYRTEERRYKADNATLQSSKRKVRSQLRKSLRP